MRIYFNVTMKVLILNPPTEDVRFSRDGRCQSEENTWLDTFPPTTFASIAGVVREKYPIKVIDCMGDKISFDKCMRMVEFFQPNFTIINTSTPTIVNDMNVAQAIKDRTGSKIISYGEHITARYEKMIEEFPQLDFAVLGEPETPIMSILSGKSEVKGVATRDFCGGIWQEPDLDKLPFPAYDLLPAYQYPMTGEKWTFMRSGRGCPYRCTYCVMSMMSNRNVRYHSVDYMIKQINWLVHDLDIKLYMFWDELSTFDKQRMLDLCQKMINTGLHKKCKWFCTTRVDCFDDELAKWMSAAGCRMISFGVESGSQEVLNRNKKGIRIEQSINAVKSAKKYGLKTIGHFVVGLPGSTPESEKETIRLSKKLKLNFAQFYVATPFPGSEFYKDAVKEGWFVNKGWDKVEQGTVAVSYPGFSAEDIKRWKDKAYVNFYFRPYAVYSLLTNISLQRLLSVPKYVINFFGWMKK